MLRVYKGIGHYSYSPLINKEKHFESLKE